MCQTFLESIARCDVGRQLWKAVCEARTAYLLYIGNPTTSQRLYDAYDRARSAYEQHMREQDAIR